MKASLDRKSIMEWYDFYWAIIRHTNEEEKKDIVQRAVIKTYNAVKNGKTDVNNNWFYTIGVNELKSWRVRRYNNIYAEMDWDVVEPANTLDYAHNNDLYNIITDAMEALPTDKYKRILKMHYFDAMSYEEISDTLGIKLGTVKSRLSRAREEMKEILLKEYKDEILHYLS